MIGHPSTEQQLQALRRLAGRERPIHQQIQQTVEAVETLAAGCRGWRAFAPKRAVLDQAVAQADAVARALRQLREDLNT